MTLANGWLAAGLGTALVIVHVLVCLGALLVLPKDRKPSTAMAWLILVLALPYVGILAFLLFGSTSVGRKRRAWQSEVNEQVLAAVAREEDSTTVAPAGHAVASQWPQDGLSGPIAGLARLNRNLGALPLSSGNDVRVITEYAGCIAAMTAAVRTASRFVHVEFYISAWDELTAEFFEALVAAARRGVEVRMLFDHLGSRGIPGYKDFLRRLEEAPIKSAAMLPIAPLKGQVRRPDLRNHRKILVVDGMVAFMGSQNLIEPGYNKPKNHRAGRQWVDLMVRVSGPAVRELNVVFATDWVAETGENIGDTLEQRPAVLQQTAAPQDSVEAVRDVACQVVPSGPGFATENNLRLFNTMLYTARSRVSLTSPYFVPDESLLYAVTTAAQRGVAVELFVNQTADQFMVGHAQRSYYNALLSAGVRIWLYPEPWVLHAKHFTIDDDLAVIGSSNMDYRSFALNYEVVLMLTGTEVVDRLRAVQADYRCRSRELTLEEWSQRDRRGQYVDNVMRLTAALQ